MFTRDDEHAATKTAEDSASETPAAVTDGDLALARCRKVISFITERKEIFSPCISGSKAIGSLSKAAGFETSKSAGCCEISLSSL